MEFCASDRATYEKFADGTAKDISDEIPFELPQEWVWVRLGCLCEVLDAKRKPITKRDRKCGPYPYYGATCIQDYVESFIFDEPLVLLGEDGAKWGKGDKSAFCVDGKIWVNNHAHVLRPFGGMCHKFLSHALTMLDLMPYITGTTVPKLNQERMCQILIPIPPLAEQKRIAAQIEELFTSADKIGEASEGMSQVGARIDKKILDLAIRGQLVPQDPNDEPASELIKRIEAAKKATAKGSKSSRTTASDRPAYETEPPFDIPGSWEWVQLKDLGRFVGGHTPSIADSSNWKDGTILWVTSKDMKQKYIRNTGCMVNEKGASELHLLPPGSLLMVTRSGILRRTFPIALAAKQLTINQDQRALEFYDNAIGEYIYYCLKSLEPIVLRDYRKTGTTVESIIWEKFVHLPIPLPPINEQRQIVAKVEELKAMISNLLNP